MGYYNIILSLITISHASASRLVIVTAAAKGTGALSNGQETREESVMKVGLQEKTFKAWIDNMPGPGSHAKLFVIGGYLRGVRTDELCCS